MNQKEPIVVQIHNHIMQIGMYRPEKKNALTAQMYQAMGQALVAAQENEDVRVVVLHGTDDAFSAGADLKGFEDRDPGTTSPGALFLTALQGFKKPVVAAVSGVAIGIGVTLLMHCDLVYAADNTRFRMPFINLGVCPEAGSSLMLPAEAGHRLAAEVLMLGDFFDTPKAMALGLVNGSVSRKKVLDHALEKAGQLAGKPQAALVLIKQLLKERDQQAIAQRMAIEFVHFGQLLQTPASVAARASLLTPSGPGTDR